MALPEQQAIQKATRMLKAVAHPARIEIISLLVREKSLSVGEIQARLNISQSMTSQHLSALKNVGIIACEKDANVCNYFILNRNILKLIDCVTRCATDHQL